MINSGERMVNKMRVRFGARIALLAILSAFGPALPAMCATASPPPHEARAGSTGAKTNCSTSPGPARSDTENIEPGNLAGDLESARALADKGCYAAALQVYRELLRNNPSSRSYRDIETELAAVLSWEHQYSAAILLYQKLLREKPDDRPVLESLGRVYIWSDKLNDAVGVDRKLLADDPSNPQYQLQFARLEIRLHHQAGARKALVALLKSDPVNRDALIDLAQLDLKSGRLEEASREFHALLGQNFQDPEALYGAATIDYYEGDLHRALPLAANLVNERPKDFDALLLLARIERALQDRKAARVLVDRASELSPHNQEADDLRETIGDESSITVHTSAYYAREIAVASPLPESGGVPLPASTLEDLDTFGAATRVDFAVLPQSSSYFVTAIMPSTSPFGGIQGAVAPSEFMYGQSTRVLSDLTIRGGIGLIRMGPGEFLNGDASVPSIALSPVGYAGATLILNPKLKVHFTASQNAITYTPTSTRFGARQRRIEAALEYQLDPHTQAQLSVFHDQDFSSVYLQTWPDRIGQVALDRNGRDAGAGGQLRASRKLICREWLNFEAGYAGTALSYTGQRRGVSMGFFNPAFYQQHLITTDFQGQFWGPIRYSFTADAGVQQVDENGPFTMAEKIGPGLTLRMSRQTSLTLGYIHYNFAQSLGSVRGNAVQFSTDYRF
jgi:tetratricopeptide (TPR) repeat protein